MEHMEIAAEQACRQIKDRKYLEGLYKKRLYRYRRIRNRLL